MDRSGLKRCVMTFFSGAAASLLWGLVTWVLKLDRVFPNDAQERLFSIALPAQIILYGVVSPVVEEVIFRGAVFHLMKKILPDIISALLTSLLFALFHGNMIQMIYAFPMGMLLQYFLKKSGSLSACIACHAGANLASVAVMAL